MDAVKRGVFFLILLAANLLTGCGFQTGFVNSASINGAQCTGQAITNSFLVKWTMQVPAEYEANRIYPGALITRFSNTDKATVESEILKKHLSEYELAEYEFQLRPAQSMPGSGIPSEWGTYDIQAQNAWSYLGTQGGGVLVAVVDSGIDANHPLLKNIIYTNTKEVPANNIDDDKNGYIDDYQGYDFTTNSGTPVDGAGHGSHVSGIIAGQPGAYNFEGVAPQARILPLKFIDSTGQGAVGNAIAAINYATKYGAKVVNASWGGAQCSDSLKAAISDVIAQGAVFVTAAGNDGVNLSQEPDWPAAFQMSGKLTVGAYNSSEYLSTFSNFGALVDIAAPGENIVSTVPPAAGQAEGQMEGMSGTSMASPFVAGVAALLYAAKPNAHPEDIVNAINNTVIRGNFGVRTSGKINALAAAQYIMTQPLATPTPSPTPAGNQSNMKPRPSNPTRVGAS